MAEIQAVGVILAAGKGVRMKSDLPKALQKVGGVPMVRLIVDSMKSAGIGRVIIVVGHKGEAILEAFGDSVEYAWQTDQLGTGHAVSVTKDLLSEFRGTIVVCPGDAPLLDEEFFRFLLRCHAGADCTVATALLENPSGYGRIVRDASGNPTKIVEEKDASPEQKQIREINSSVYCFDSVSLFKAIPGLRNTNAQSEYYLTDVVAILANNRQTVRAVAYSDPSILVGVNDRWQLAQAEKQLQTRLLKKHALNGVTIMSLETTYVGPYVKLGEGVVLEPGCVLLGETSIGARSVIGPHTKIDSSELGEECSVVFSLVANSKFGAGVKCGPFANVRPETDLGDRVKVGNYVEVKKSTLGAGASVAHLSYIGDAEIGSETNIGAGVITCNYDGFVKSRTKIGDGVFVGSNATLVAPLSIESGAMIAAGSTITNDVPAEAGAFGRARQETKLGWAARWREMRRAANRKSE